MKEQLTPVLLYARSRSDSRGLAKLCNSCGFLIDYEPYPRLTTEPSLCVHGRASFPSWRAVNSTRRSLSESLREQYGLQDLRTSSACT